MAKDFLMPLRHLHGHIYESILLIKEKRKLREKYINPFLQKNRNNSKCVFLVLTPEHTNLGDHAIALAEIELFKKNNIDYVEVTGKQLQELKEKKALGIFNKFPIIINGGGNLGTLWFDVEQIMRALILKNPKSPIFIFPNSIYYEGNEWGKEEFLNSQKIYNAHKNLHIYAREKISFNKMYGLYRDVKLVPDMVLSFDKCGEDFERSGCLVCLRSDKEKTITEENEKLLHKTLREIFGDNVKNTDTHSLENVFPKDRETYLSQKYCEFKKFKLVITDRLHGMIFCAITGTPCIVLNSKSPKVRGCYEWIKHLDYIRFADSTEDIVNQYQQIPSREHHYDNSHLTHYYESLAEDIKSIWR
ncbi:MAG: hypothetical protein E7614_08615 [Ruminococcaceae bacterium]|nr:hypothetical protein [Oscillospiraceae bacterium]